VDFQHFILMVQREAGGISAEEAERATRAVLETLAERLSSGHTRHIAEQLPAELRPWIETDTDAQALDLDDFLGRVAEREGVDLETADRHTHAVFFALGQSVAPAEIDDLEIELPKNFGPLIAEARRRNPNVIPAEEFLSRVAQRAGLDPDGARRATDVVLETLAERISGGQVEDMLPQLPPELHEPLKRGVEASGGLAVRMTLDEFLERVAQRENLTVDQAREHAKAVLTTLREAISEREFRDMWDQLPNEFGVLLTA
jgi:uncharacterized protein (DUF2267 family)